MLHNNPISTTSSSKEPYRNIKFLKERIWIPWRISDYRSNTLNFTDSYLLDIELSKLYCIEMDDLDMGDSWDTDQINYVQL